MEHIQTLNILPAGWFKTFVKSIFLFYISSLLFSCAKTEIVTDLDFQKNLLAGTGALENTKHVWKIDSASLNGTMVIKNGVSIATPNSKKIITITFLRDGSYTESDGNFGFWTLPEIKELRVNVTDGITGSKRSFKYEVADLNAAKLHLKFDSAGFKQDLYYNIYN